MSGTYDFGGYNKKNTSSAVSYKANAGDLLSTVESKSVPLHNNDDTQLVIFNASARISRVEWYFNGPFGTLLLADDLNYADWTAANAGGWGLVTGGAGSVTWGGGHVDMSDGSTITCWGIYHATPTNADTFVAKGVQFLDTETSLHWVMVSLHANGVDNNLGSSGYRVLMRDIHPHNVEIVDSGPTIPDPTPPPQTSVPLLRQRQRAA